MKYVNATACIMVIFVLACQELGAQVKKLFACSEDDLVKVPPGEEVPNDGGSSPRPIVQDHSRHLDSCAIYQ